MRGYRTPIPEGGDARSGDAANMEVRKPGWMAAQVMEIIILNIAHTGISN